MKNILRIQSLNLPLERILSFVVLAFFIGVVPFYVHNQWLTGPFVNALLILACVLVGPMEAILLGLLPSTMALSSGLLPLPLAPMVPFIMISNAIFIAVFFYLSKKSFSIAVVVAASIKFLFLFGFSTLIAQNLFADTLLPKIAVMMSWPQFLTALLGGIFAFTFIKFLKKN